MNDKLILLEDIKSLGKAGDIVSVSAGYGRNYLMPKKLALKASKGAIRQLDSLKEKLEATRLAEIAKMKVLAVKIAELEIKIPMNIGEDDKLYGSVTSHTIADEMKKLGIEISHHKLLLDSPLKELGAFDIDIKLHPEVVAKAHVCLVRA